MPSRQSTYESSSFDDGKVMQMRPASSDEREIRFSSSEAGAGSANRSGNSMVDKVKKHTGYDTNHSQQGISSSSSSDESRVNRKKFYDDVYRRDSSSSSTSFASVNSQPMVSLSNYRMPALRTSSSSSSGGEDGDKTPVGSPLKEMSFLGKYRKRCSEKDLVKLRRLYVSDESFYSAGSDSS